MLVWCFCCVQTRTPHQERKEAKLKHAKFIKFDFLIFMNSHLGTGNSKTFTVMLGDERKSKPYLEQLICKYAPEDERLETESFHPWKRKIIFQTIIFRFYVNLQGVYLHIYESFICGSTPPFQWQSSPRLVCWVGDPYNYSFLFWHAGWEFMQVMTALKGIRVYLFNFHGSQILSGIDIC